MHAKYTIEKKYKLVWKGEIIETDLSYQEAVYLQKEYNLAYGGGVTKKLQYKVYNS